MKSIYFFFLCFVVVSEMHLCAQNDTLEIIDTLNLGHYSILYLHDFPINRSVAVDGKYCGYYKTANGKFLVAFNCFYVNHLAEGKWTVYNPEGILVEEISFHEGKIMGSYRSWYNNGSPLYEGTYRTIDSLPFTSKITDETKITLSPAEYYYIYHDSAVFGSISYSSFKTGEWKLYDEKGILRQKENYDSYGKMKISVHFDSTGIVDEEGFDNSYFPYDSTYRVMYKTELNKAVVINGNGIDTSYYDDGKRNIYSITEYKNGYIEGTQVYFSIEGKIISEYHYSKGIRK